MFIMDSGRIEQILLQVAKAPGRTVPADIRPGKMVMTRS